jgi:hypothetical protein
VSRDTDIALGCVVGAWIVCIATFAVVFRISVEGARTLFVAGLAVGFVLDVLAIFFANRARARTRPKDPDHRRAGTAALLGKVGIVGILILGGMMWMQTP